MLPPMRSHAVTKGHNKQPPQNLLYEEEVKMRTIPDPIKSPDLIDYQIKSGEVVKVTRQKLSELLEAKERKKNALDNIALVKEIIKVAIEEVEATN
ncbi:hypothetical protein Tco_0857089 [Tanacetum coccineum]|uniref:Uncharacterized protein n=1 Tax=Tanacetum coccineum TaxID=301880 RepID=A0ABQ5B8N4_9ASTR